MFDARVLRNPYWEPFLRDYTGLDEAVITFLKKQEQSHAMIDDIAGFLNRWLPHIQPGSRSVLTVAVGCTGGRHRSVFIVEQLFQLLKSQITNCKLIRRHRDLQATLLQKQSG